MASSRRDILKRGAGVAATAAGWSFFGTAHAQVKEEAGTDPLQITRKGINKDLEVINIDLLEAQAKAALPEGVYVFIANGNGDQWTLRENRRAFGDYVFMPRRMGGVREGRHRHVRHALR